MKKGKRLLLLCLMLVILSTGSVWLSNYNERTAMPEETQTQEEDVVSLQPDTVQEISVSYLGDTVTLRRSDETWVDADDPAFPLDANYAESMTEALADMRAARSVAGGPEEYGLDTPECTVSALSGDGSRTTLHIGDKNPTTGQYYVRVDGEAAIYAVAASAVTPFMLTRYEMITAEEFPAIQPDSVVRAALRVKNGDLALVYLPEGSKEMYTASYKWFIEEADSLTPVSAEGARAYVEEALDATYLGCVAYDAGAQLSEFGLDAPAATLEITYTDQTQVSLNAQEFVQMRALYDLTNLEAYGLLDDWIVEEEEMDLAERIGAYWSAEADDGVRTYDVTHVRRLTIQVSAPDASGRCYMRHSDSQRIFEVSPRYVDTLTAISAQSLRDASVCPVEKERLTRLTAVYGGVSKVIDVDRTPVQDESGSYKSNVAYRIGAKELDGAQFTAFVNRITALKAEAYTDSKEIGNVVMTVIFEQISAKYPSMTLALYTYDSSFYRASFAGREDMLVSKRDVEALIARFEAIGTAPEA